MVRAKKHLGQHFLLDGNIAQQIVDALQLEQPTTVLEIGPGTGVLTSRLLARDEVQLHVVELDVESVMYLKKNFPALGGNIHAQDFLKMDLSAFEGPLHIIGNFPYNISSQILFHMLDYRTNVPQLVGMFQKEVAQRVASGPGTKNYGILSVLVQAYYEAEYLFTVPPDVFDPPPKVDSGVIRLKRRAEPLVSGTEGQFKTVVKTAFNQRRKTLRNSLKGLSAGRELPEQYSGQRPEQLEVLDFVALTQFLYP